MLIFLWEKVAQAPLSTYYVIFLGLGWPWVGEFVGFIIIFRCFPTQRKLVNRKHPFYYIVFCTGYIFLQKFSLDHYY